MTSPYSITIFIYNRPDKVRNLLDSLKNNYHFETYEYYIFSDGPKRKSDEKKIFESREIIKNFFKDLNFHLITRKKNFGLAKSVIQGVSYVLNFHKSTIILEDDLILSNNFLKFMKESLDKYKENNNIYSISGHMFDSEKIFEIKSSFFLNNINSWGWATWDNRWEKFMSFLEEFKDLSLSNGEKYFFDLENSYPFSKILRKTNRGEIDSWAIKWYLFVFKNNGLSLYPNNSLILNNGFDGSGTNTFSTLNNELNRRPFEIKFPKRIELNEKGYNLYKSEIKNNLNPPLYKKIILKIKSIIKK